MGYQHKALRMADSSNAPFFVDTEVIVLNRNGLWLSDGVEIDHTETRRAFARGLRHDAQGYFIQIGRETKRIQVEDTPFFIHRVDGDPFSGVELWLNDETRERLDPSNLTYRPGRLSCRLSKDIGHGPEEARFLHSAYFDLLRFLDEDAEGYFLIFGSGSNTQRVMLSYKA